MVASKLFCSYCKCRRVQRQPQTSVCEQTMLALPTYQLTCGHA